MEDGRASFSSMAMASMNMSDDDDGEEDGIKVVGWLQMSVTSEGRESTTGAAGGEDAGSFTIGVILE